MIGRALAGLVPPWAWAVLLVAALAGAFAAGDRWGSTRVTARVQAAEIARHRAEDAEVAELRRRGHRAGAKYEAQRRRIEVRYVQVPAEVREALAAPAQCASAPTLADIPVPAAVVDSLRRAGADPGPAGTAAGEPDDTVRSGPELADR